MSLFFHTLILKLLNCTLQIQLYSTCHPLQWVNVKTVKSCWKLNVRRRVHPVGSDGYVFGCRTQHRGFSTTWRLCTGESRVKLTLLLTVLRLHITWLQSVPRYLRYVGYSLKCEQPTVLGVWLIMHHTNGCCQHILVPILSCDS